MEKNRNYSLISLRNRSSKQMFLSLSLESKEAISKMLFTLLSVLIQTILGVQGDAVTHFARVPVESSKILSNQLSPKTNYFPLKTECAQICSNLGSSSCNGWKWTDTDECSIYVLNLTIPLMVGSSTFEEIFVDVGNLNVLMLSW